MALTLAVLFAASAAVPAALGASNPVGPASRHPDAGLALIANPTQGPVPLTVGFQLSVPNGSLPYLSWSFGDGSWLNGSLPSDLAPVHRYTSSGAFLVRVVAAYPSGTVEGSTSIQAIDASLSATANASAVLGPAPFTLWLNGSPAGGSGTYVSETWDLGDGDHGTGSSIHYTYLRPGEYQANFSVTDSVGREANASVNVTVVPPLSTTPPPIARTNGSGNLTLPAATPSLTTPIVVGLVAGGLVVLLAIALWVRWSRRRYDPPTELLAPTTPARVEPPVPPETAESRTSSVEQGDAGGAGPPAPEPNDPRPAKGGPALPRVLAYRVLRHLASLPPESASELPPFERTQAGIAAALSVGQSAVSKILRRLEAAGTVAGHGATVIGSSRKVRVYHLTERGERLGLALMEDPLHPPQ